MEGCVVDSRGHRFPRALQKHRMPHHRHRAGLGASHAGVGFCAQHRRPGVVGAHAARDVTRIPDSAASNGATKRTPLGYHRPRQRADDPVLSRAVDTRL